MTKTLAEEEIAIIDPMHDRAPEYAALFSKATGTQWRAEGGRRYDDGKHAVRHFHLIREDNGATISIGIELDRSHKKAHRVTACPRVPAIPDGTDSLRFTSLREYYIRDASGKKLESIEAGVSLARFLEQPEAAARRFIKEVVEPYAAIWPQIQAHIANANAGFKSRDEVAAALAAKFSGRVDNRNTGSSLQVHFGEPYDLPTLVVQPGGSIRFTHTPTLSLGVATAFLGAVLAERKAKRPA